MIEIPTRWIKIFKDIRGSTLRALLVIFSIGVGVGAIGMINNTMVMMERDLFGAYGVGNPSSIGIYVSPFQEELATAVGDMREMEAAQARRTLEGVLILPDGVRQDAVLNSYPDFNTIRVNRFLVEQGSGVPVIREIVLERQGANKLGLQIGDTLIYETESEEQFPLTVSGIVHDLYSMPFNIRGDLTGYVSMDTLQWMRQGSYYNQIDVIVAGDQYNRAHVIETAGLARDRVIEPAGYAVYQIAIPGINADPGKHWAQNQINGFTLVLQVMSVMVIFLSGGLVINTISAILSQQIRQIGIMRSVGAVRNQLISMYLLNMLVFCIAGLVIGLPLGMLGAWGLTEFAANYINFTITAITLDPMVLVLQIAVGLVMPMGVALYPIVSGTRISVYDAIYQYGLSDEGEDGTLDRLLNRLRNMHPPVMLSLRNTFRKKARLAFTLITLTLAGAMFMSVFSTRASLNEQINQVSRYVAFDAALGVNNGVSRMTAEREALRIPGVTVAEGWMSGSAILVDEDGNEGEELQIYGIPYDTVTVDPLLLAGRWLIVDDSQQIVVNDDLTERIPGVHIGSELILKVDGKEHTYEVVGIASKHLSGPRAYMTYAGFAKATGRLNEADSVRIRRDASVLTSPPEQRALAQELESRFEDSGLSRSVSQTQSGVFSDFSGPFDIILIVLIIMAALLALVGSLSLTGTMGMNVMERTREIGVLRAVGANNSAVRQVVVIEGVVVGLISWLLAVAASWPSGLALAGAVVKAVLRSDLIYKYSLQGLAIWLVIIVLIGVFASLAPARSAVRLTVREVLDYE
jgi:putative ABC transport system permease protein